jgi:hypothetical protein
MTNITSQHRASFEALVSGDYDNFALFSCFMNGQPAAAIVAVNRDGAEYTISPLFVALTPGMLLTDHDGTCCASPSPNPLRRERKRHPNVLGNCRLFR